MISQLAREDIEQLVADGLNPSVDDIVRLNALGLKIERGVCPAESLFYLPRIAYLGEIVLRQPTMGHEIWLDEVASTLDMEDPMTNLAATAFACSVMDADDLPNPHGKVSVVLALANFKRKICTFTIQQIVVATRYVVDGNDALLYETPIVESENKDDDEVLPSERISIPVGIIYDGMSIGLDITLEEAKKMTQSKYIVMVKRYLRSHGMIDMKNDQEQTKGDYFATLDAIRKRLQAMRDKDNGKQ